MSHNFCSWSKRWIRVDAYEIVKVLHNRKMDVFKRGVFVSGPEKL